MNCNREIHNEMINMGELICPFCNEEIEVNVSDRKPFDTCCDRQEIINDGSAYVCKHCGQIAAYNYADEYINFHENMYKIRRKSVYHRKYHIENVIYKANISIPRIKMEKICRVIDEIAKIAPTIDPERKRIISINFLIRQLLKYYLSDSSSNYKDIRITSSKKTLRYYRKYWNVVIELIGDKIESILK